MSIVRYESNFIPFQMATQFFQQSLLFDVQVCFVENCKFQHHKIFSLTHLILLSKFYLFYIQSTALFFFYIQLLCLAHSFIFNFPESLFQVCLQCATQTQILLCDLIRKSLLKDEFSAFIFIGMKYVSFQFYYIMYLRITYSIHYFIIALIWARFVFLQD